MSAPDLIPDSTEARSDLDHWDPVLAERVVGILRPVVKRYFRSEVRGLSQLPAGGALLVANHSGGMLTTDPPTFAVDYYDRFGYTRPIYTLSHDVFSHGPTKQFFLRTGSFQPAPKTPPTPWPPTRW